MQDLCCSPCDILVITVTCRRLTPTVSKSRFGVVLQQTACWVCDSQTALPVGGDLEGDVAFWCAKIAIYQSWRISEREEAC